MNRAGLGAEIPMKDFQFGIDGLIHKHMDWLQNARAGLVAHPASINTSGDASAERLCQNGALVCLFGPEHGFAGMGGAGDLIADQVHPQWGIPVYSLYGKTKKPTPEMLAGIDVIVFDLQDLGVRAYTYVSTLKYVLEAAAENGKRVIVADRPCPLARVIDGPLLNPEFASFVGLVPAPVVYGMTPGETALWLKQELKLDLDLRVAEMTGYHRETTGSPDWPAWIPPSPAIRSWACALCFPITVYLEALPALDHGRGTETPFQLVGAPWLDGLALCDELSGQPLAGVQFESCSYVAGAGAYQGQKVQGVRIIVEDPNVFAPVQTGIAIIEAVQNLYEIESLWSSPGTRPEFFDQLMGTSSVRLALLAGRSAREIALTWAADLDEFRAKRQSFLLYPAD